MDKQTVSLFYFEDKYFQYLFSGETYLHRIGRTGRFGKHGLAINLVDGPKSMAVLKEIERHFGKDIVKLDAEVVQCFPNIYKTNLDIAGR